MATASEKPTHVVINYDKGSVPIQKYGVVSDVVCDFLCVSGIGSYKKPLKEDVEDQIHYLIKWTNKIGFPQTKSVKYEELAKTGGALSVYLAPNISPKSEKMRVFGKYCVWLLVMDDIMDEKTSEEPPTSTFAQLSQDLNVFIKILSGELNPADGASVPAQVSTMSHFAELAVVVQNVHHGFDKHLEAFKSHKNRAYLIKSTKDFCHAFLWRFGRKNQNHPSQSTYIFFRRQHSASFCIFEIVALLNDMDWATAGIEREQIEFENWRNAYADSLSVSNDVLSFRKELTDDETENLAIHKYYNQVSDINVAIRNTVRFTNAATGDMAAYATLLMERSPELGELKRLVEFCGWSLDGHLNWYGFTKRYGEMKLDERHLTEDQFIAVLLGGRTKLGKDQVVEVY